MASLPIEVLYAPPAKTEEELQQAIAAPAKAAAGKARGDALLLAADALIRKKEPNDAVKLVREALALFRQLAADEQEAMTLCILAKARIGGAFNLEALQAANKAVRIFKELGNQKGEAAALYVISQVHEATPSPEDAAWKASEARKIFKQIGEKVGEGAALELMAKSYALQQNFPKGQTTAQDALALFKELGEGVKEAGTLCVLAKMHIGLGDQETGLQVAKDALAKFQELGLPTDEPLDIVVSAHLKRGEKDDAVFMVQQEAEDARQRGDKAKEAAVMFKIAQLHLDENSPAQALGPSAEAISLFKGIADKKGEAEALLLNAKAKLQQKERGDAQRQAEAANTIFRDLGPQGLDGMIGCMEVLVGIHVQAKALQQAFDTSIAFMNGFKAAGNSKGEGAALMEIVALQVRIKEINGALTTMKGVPALFQAAGDRKREAAAWLKLAGLHAQQNQQWSAKKAAEEAMAINRKFSDMLGVAQAGLILASAHFGLSEKGNAREALKVAGEAVSIYRAAGDKAAEVNALNVLANAQLMTQTFADAQASARAAEALCQELSDSAGQASALLIVAGAHLGAGDFAEARDVAKEARDLFADIGLGQGEDSAEDFLDILRKYEDGRLDRADFMGFTMGSNEEAQPQQSTRKKDKEKKKDYSQLSNIDCLLPGPKGNEKLSITYFIAFEARRATAPTRGPAARRASEAAGAEEDGPDTRRKEPVEPATFAVRLMPQTCVGEDPPKKLPKDTMDPEDRRINMSMDLGQPNVKFPGRCGKSERMFYAMGAQMGVS